ncbi:MAG: ATP-binding protein [Gammaproteobacteria bacterium]|nr:ATP-binding protein [Gammaproteobacteria bacterium]
MYIPQYWLNSLQDYSWSHKVIVILGPRRTGKTTLLNHLLQHEQNYLFVSGEDIDVRSYLESQSITKLKSFIGKHSLLVIDEAQKIAQVGLNLKLIVDHIPEVRVIVTGSSAFDLAKQVGEPLTGRKITFPMFPLSQLELGPLETPAQTRGNLELRLIYGSYPEVILTPDLKAKQAYLHELVSSYLYKDILELEGIRKASHIPQLLQLLALQLGREVSHQELGQQLGMNRRTVERYLDLLEKTFVIINLRGFSRNLRSEVTKMSRYYFYDLGIRNAIINQFNPLSLRSDIGELWENYIVIERLKKQAYHQILSHNYFWRTYEQQEIDWVEDREGILHGYEIKWQKPSRVKEPSAWRTAYPESVFEVIHRDNYLKFIAED